MSISDEQQTQRNAYNRVVRVVYHNTTPKQPPMLRKTAITLHCEHAGLSASMVDEKLKLAVKHNDLITDGHGRYCVTDDKERLRRAADAVAKHVPTDKQLLGTINKAMMQL